MPRSGRFHLRAFISIYLVVSGLVLALTGIVCYIKPPARVAVWIDWRFLGLEKGAWESLHTIFAFLFVAAAVTHVVLNWKAFWSYIRSRVGKGLNRRLELALATGLTLAFFGLTLAGVFPFGAFMRLGDRASEGWGRGDATPPIARIERYSLATFCRLLELDLDSTVAELRAAGLTGVDPAAPVRDIATTNRIPPREIGRILNVEIVK